MKYGRKGVSMGRGEGKGGVGRKLWKKEREKGKRGSE